MPGEPVLQEDRILGGRYRADEVMKRGSDSATYLAMDLHEGRRVVVKTARTTLVSTAVRMRLEHEAAVLSRISGPSFAPLLDMGRDGDDVFVVTAFVPGRTLEERLKEGPLTLSDALVVAMGVLRGLQETHDLGVLHRDVKPANIIVGDGRPIPSATLIDFGLARSAYLEASIRDLPVGTTRYISPEQAGLLDHDADERSDLYSAGVVLFECLAGRPPFAGDTVGVVLRQHLTAPPPDLRELGFAVPRVVDDVVQRLLRKDPRDRYQSAEAVLADLEDIAEAIRQGVAEPAVVVGAHDRRRTLTEPAFVGRKQDLEALQAALGRAAEGDGGLVFLEAESGGGKTRLIDELNHLATQRGFWVLRGQGIDQAARWPYQMLTGVATSIIGAVHDDPDLAEAVRGRVGEDAASVCDALPELRSFLATPTSADLGPEAHAERRSLRALAGLLDALGDASQPALVVLDDAQWADDATLKLLAHWLSSGEGQAGRHVTVLASFRTEEVGAAHRLRRTEADLRIELAPLAAEDLRALLESMAGSLPEEATDTAVRLSDGSPFMAEAVLRGMVEAEVLRFEGDEWRVDLQAISDVRSSRQSAAFLTRRIELLPPDVQQLLRVGAVLGKEFAIDSAARLAGQEPAQAMAAVAEARRRHFVWMRSRPGHCAFVHDKLRETLLGAVPASQLRALHRSAARDLEDRRPERVFEIAYHYDEAGEPGRALQFAMQAGLQARERHSLELAEEQYRIAERGSEGTGADVQRRIAEGLGDVLMLRGRYADAAQYLRQARRLRDSSWDRAQIDAKLSELAFKTGDLAGSAAAAEGALREIGHRVPHSGIGYLLWALWEVLVQTAHSLFPRLLCGRRSPKDAESEFLAMRLNSRLAHVYWFTRGAVPTLWTHLREMNLAERYPPSLELAQAYSEHAPCMTLLPWYGRGIRYVQRSLQIRTELGDVWGQGQSLNFYGVLLYGASRYAEGHEKSREAARLLERTGDRWELNIARIHAAFCLYRMGELSAAVDEVREVHSSGLEIGDPQASGIGVEIWSKATGGRVPAGLLAAELEREGPDVQLVTEVMQGEAVRLLGEGRPEAAVKILLDARRRVRRARLRQEYVAGIQPWLSTALREAAEAVPLWDPRRRARLLRRARRMAAEGRRLAWFYRNNRPHVLREVGILRAMRGRLRAARRALDASLAEADRQGARAEHAMTLLVRGQIGLAHGWSRAAEDLATARARLQRLAVSTQAAPTAGSPDPEAEPTLSLIDRFATVLDAGRNIATALSREAIYGAVREAALQLLRGERCIVLRVDGTPEADTDLTTVSGEFDVVYSKSLALRAAREGRPVVYNEQSDASSSESLELSGARSALCAPVAVRGRPAICFYVSHEQVGGLFGPEEEGVAAFIATLAGAALENAENFGEIEGLTRTLEERVQERTTQLERSNRELDRSLRKLQVAYDRERDVVRKLRELDELKSDFLSTVSHELRTPLTAIGGFSQTLLDRWDGLSDDVRSDFVKRIARHSGDLDALISELLDFSRLERGSLKIQSQPCDVRRYVEASVHKLGPVLARHEVVIDVPEGAVVLADPIACERALENLLTNAAKFSAPGTSIEVRAAEDGDRVVVSVKDSGLGIPADERDHIFERFYRIERGDHAKTGGTGIGLAIVKEFIEAQGGSVWVNSRPGEGSVFSFSLKRAVDTPPAVVARSPGAEVP